MAALCSHVLFGTSAEALHGVFTPQAYRTNFKLVVIKDYESAFDAVILVQIP